jgi:transposase
VTWCRGLEAALSGLEAARERERRLELRLAEAERRLGMDSSDSGTPGSKERIGAKEARRARRRESERERSQDRKRGGQPGHKGKGLARDPDPDDRKDAEPPAQCRACHSGLDGADAVEPRWAQVIDVEVVRKVTEWLLPGLACPCCGMVTFAEPPPGLHPGAVSYGPVLNAAAVLLSCYGNVPPERAAQVMAMLLGVPVSAGRVDKAATRISAQLGKVGFDDAMIAALTAEGVLAADETPVNVLDRTAPPAAAPAGDQEKDPEEKDKAAAGAPHMLIVRTPDGRLTFLQAIGSRRKEVIASGLPGLFTGTLITDGCTGYQHLLSRLAGPATSSRSCAKLIRPSRPPASAAIPAWTAGLRERYDTAVTSGIIHNRLRDWHEGNHPGYALGSWLRNYKEQVFLFTRDFAVAWTNNVSERGAKAANAIRQSPGTGIPSPPSPAGAASAATSTPPPPTASAHSTPSAPLMREIPGYRHSPPQPDTNSRTL